MALAAHVQARWSAADLVTLTRQGSPAATTVDATKLGLACDGAEAEFATLVGLTYDDADNEHIRVAVLGVIAHLHDWTTAYDEAQAVARKRWEAACAVLAQARGARTVTLPQTTSRFDPTQELQDERPAFDRDRQRGYVIGRRGEVDDQER